MRNLQFSDFRALSVQLFVLEFTKQIKSTRMWSVKGGGRSLYSNLHSTIDSTTSNTMTTHNLQLELQMLDHWSDRHIHRRNKCRKAS